MDKKTLVMAPTDPRCTIGTKTDTKAVYVNSLDECSGRCRANKKTRIIVGTVHEVEIGMNATALCRRRTFVVAIFDLGLVPAQDGPLSERRRSEERL